MEEWITRKSTCNLTVAPAATRKLLGSMRVAKPSGAFTEKLKVLLYAPLFVKLKF